MTAGQRAAARRRNEPRLSGKGTRFCIQGVDEPALKQSEVLKINAQHGAAFGLHNYADGREKARLPWNIPRMRLVALSVVTEGKGHTGDVDFLPLASADSEE